MELRNNNLFRAKNLFEKCIFNLSQCDKIWSKYIQLENILGNKRKIRYLFKRLIILNPTEINWSKLIEVN